MPLDTTEHRRSGHEIFQNLALCDMNPQSNWFREALTCPRTQKGRGPAHILLALPLWDLPAAGSPWGHHFHGSSSSSSSSAAAAAWSWSSSLKLHTCLVEPDRIQQKAYWPKGVWISLRPAITPQQVSLAWRGNWKSNWSASPIIVAGSCPQHSAQHKGPSNPLIFKLHLQWHLYFEDVHMQQLLPGRTTNRVSRLPVDNGFWKPRLEALGWTESGSFQRRNNPASTMAAQPRRGIWKPVEENILPRMSGIGLS